MLTLGHILTEIIAGRTLESAVISLLPDIIRALGIPRSATHFTGNLEIGYSWIKFPEKISELKSLTSIEQVEFENVIKAPKMLDELTSIDRFMEILNESAIESMLSSNILYHLKEDDIFDRWNRRFILEVPGTNAEEYYIKSERLSAKAARQRIIQIEQRSIYMLAKMLYMKHGIIFNKNYIEQNVKPILFDVYSEKLANSAFGYMTIDEKYNCAISKKNFDITDPETDMFYNDIKDLHSKLFDKIKYE